MELFFFGFFFLLLHFLIYGSFLCCIFQHKKCYFKTFKIIKKYFIHVNVMNLGKKGASDMSLNCINWRAFSS